VYSVYFSVIRKETGFKALSVEEKLEQDVQFLTMMVERYPELKKRLNDTILPKNLQKLSGLTFW
jgi:molybdopterin converting factor small subunit